MTGTITRREFLKALGLGAAALAIPGCLNTVTSQGLSKKPNIVLIMADDMGFSDIGCYGGEINTPNIDNLAANGLRFTQFYNAARCCPTRASILTGLYPHQTGIGHMNVDLGDPAYQGYLNENCVTIAEVIRPAGYSTYIVGKWHLCDFDLKTKTSKQKQAWPLQRGFDRFYGTLAGAGSYYDPHGLMQDNTPVKCPYPSYYFTDAISDNAAAFINDHAKEKPDKPFFLYVAYTAPHWPLHAPEHAVAKYKGKYDEGWDELRQQRHKRMIKMGIVEDKWELSARHPDVKPWQETDHKPWWSRCMEVYAAQIDIMDAGIGRIVTALEKTGKLDDTLIMFLSDNGACQEEIKKTGWYQTSGIAPHVTRDGRPIKVGNYTDTMPGPETTYAGYALPWANASNTPLRKHKKMTHEGGIATPLVVHWPAGVKSKGRLRHQPGHVVDIMATCIDAAGTKYPKLFGNNPITTLQGKNLTPAFDGNKAIEREAIYFEHMGNRAVRKGKFKLVSDFDQPWELYDLRADRTETNNLIDKYPDKAKELELLYNNWANRCGVKPWNQVSPDWAKNQKKKKPDE